MEVQETRVQTDRVLTIPNILSMARLVGVPLFLWLILRPEFGGPKSDGWALLVLALSGSVTTWTASSPGAGTRSAASAGSSTRPRTGSTFSRLWSVSPGARFCRSG